MNVTPRTSQEIAEMGLLPKGEYDFEVRKAEDSKTGPNSKQPGTEIIKLELIVFTESGRKQVVRDILHPSMEVKLYNFCSLAGILDAYNSGDLKAYHCEGVAGRVKIKVSEEKGDFPARNEVAGYVVPKAGEPAKPAAPSKPAKKDDEAEGDDIPF